MKGELLPILVYPEGTCSNGYALMRFKKGAFMHKKPIKIHAIKYNAAFAPSFNNTHPFISLFLTTGQLWGELEAFEIEEPLDPLWVAKKYNLDEDDPELWKYVAREVKGIISFVTGFHDVDVGLNELSDFEDAEARKKYDFRTKLCNRKCNIKDFGKSKLQEAMEKKII